MKRRECLALAAIPLAQALDRQPFRSAPGAVVGVDGAPIDRVDLVRDWDARFCRSRVVNRTDRPVRLEEVVLFAVDLKLPPQTSL